MALAWQQPIRRFRTRGVTRPARAIDRQVGGGDVVGRCADQESWDWSA